VNRLVKWQQRSVVVAHGEKKVETVQRAGAEAK